LILKPKQEAWVRAAEAAGYPAGSIVGYAEIDSVCESLGGVTRPWWMINDKAHRAGRGKFCIPSAEASEAAPIAPPPSPSGMSPQPVAAPPAAAVAPVIPMRAAPEAKSPVSLAKVAAVTESAIPDLFANYVPFGHFKDVVTIVESRMFYPVFITGLSGNGKTLMVEQACAKAKRECFRVPISKLTDEEDLIGGFRLVDGETVWFDGPVPEAMRRGALLLLDEADQGTENLMCLQGVLEGKPLLLKKINEIVKPAAGFNIIATANTKGKGDETGRFIGANIMNEAFLDRFPITLEQEYPSVAVESKIMRKELSSRGVADDEFAAKLVNWADIIRKTYYEGGVDELIATRRLVHIVGAYAMFRDKMKAITLGLSRFDEETKASFLDLYTKVDETAGVPEESEEEGEAKPEEKPSDENEELIPF
tara:strand:- start:105 stop:1370 length:1266 start_codon:yes stop_codon:yes gene_type:complete